MKIKLVGEFMSLNSFEFETTANLNVITGANGSGKSQLIQLFSTALQSHKPVNNEYPYYEKDINGTNIQKNFHLYFESDKEEKIPKVLHWNSNGKYLNTNRISYKIFRNFIIKLLYNLKKDPQLLINFDIPDHEINDFNSSTIRSNEGALYTYFPNSLNDYNFQQSIFDEISQRSGKKKDELEIQDFLCFLPYERIFNQNNLNDRDIIEYYIFFYNMQVLYREIYNINIDDLGDDPIYVLNNLIQESGFKYEFISFDIEKYRKAKGVESVLLSLPDYELKIRKKSTDTLISLNSLSSGEKIILSLGLTNYFSKSKSKIPSYILLDEFDAHLHPGLIPKLFNLIYGDLVKKHSCKVIMITHNPSTIALTPKNDDCKVFIMKNDDKTEIIEDTSNNFTDSINLLTEGLVIVNKRTKYIFVEDEDDERFYSNINSINKISKELVFVPSSNRTKDTNGKTNVNQSGGKDAVNNWITRFEKINDLFDGLIDLDAGNEKFETKLHLLERYSIENYYFDPLVLFSFLNSFQVNNDQFKQFNIPKGTEHTILNNEILVNKIVNYILEKLGEKVISQIENELNNNSLKYSKETTNIDEITALIEVEFSNGLTLKYPSWLLYYRGKNLNSICNQVFGWQPNNAQLEEHFNRMAMYPLELIEKLESLK